MPESKTSDQLLVGDAGELTALLRAIVEAKFHSAERDPECATGAVLAEVARRIRDALVAHDERRDGARARARAQWWSKLTPERTEWSIAIESANEFWATSWPRWDDGTRRAVVRDLLAPFEIDEDNLVAFIRQLDRRIAGR
jgi:hypothetical protein